MTDPAVAAAQDAVRALKGRIQSLDDNGLDLIFREARTFNGWQDRDVPDDLLRTLFDVAKMGPTAANGSPMRVVFVKSKEGKDRLKPALSGGNVQRAVLARELSGEVDVLIVANPCFGLDFASVAEIRAQIIDQRNNGAAVLLVSEDLDEILELSDRVAVMSEGKITYVAPIGETDRNTIGTYMAGH